MANLTISGDTSGSVTFSAPAIAGSPVVTLPSTTGTMALISNTLQTGSNASNTQTFTANGTWTKPASGTFAVVQCWGAGGGGAAGADARGAGGGAFHERIFFLSDLTATVAVTVGAGGAAGATGTAGGTTSFGAFLSSFGGGGAGTAAGDEGGGGGSGSAGGTADNTPGNAAAPVGGFLPTTAFGGIFTSNGVVSNVACLVQVLSNPRQGPGNDGVYGGGTGGTSQTKAGSSIYGGGGGGSVGVVTGGSSTYGGAGGNGNAAGAGTAGSAPGGGGGSGTTAGGAGGRGECRVYVF